MKHVHADLIKQWLDDTDTKFEQPLDNNGGWVAISVRELASGFGEGSRVKPKTININGFEVPEPIRDPLFDNDIYYAAGSAFAPFLYRWRSSAEDYVRLYAGIIHSTKEAAQKHTGALRSFTERNNPSQ